MEGRPKGLRGHQVQLSTWGEMKPRVGDVVRSSSKVTDSTAKVGPSPLSTESIWSWTRMPAALSLNKEGQGSGVAVPPIHVGSGWVRAVSLIQRERACASPCPWGKKQVYVAHVVGREQGQPRRGSSFSHLGIWAPWQPQTTARCDAWGQIQCKPHFLSAREDASLLPRWRCLLLK